MVQLNLFAKQKIEIYIENKCMDTKEGRGDGMHREIGIDIYICQYYDIHMSCI